MKILSFIKGLLDYIYKRRCYLCSKSTDEGIICKECLDNLKEGINFHDFKKFNAQIYSATKYSGDIQKILRAIKYHKQIEFDTILADMLVELSDFYKLDLTDFIVCPVPIHANRLKKRKYNHMALIAQKFCKIKNLKFADDIIIRAKDTPPLYKIKFAQRSEIVKDVFKVTQDLTDKKILILEDIVTSGSTLKELSRVIYEKKAKEIRVLTVSIAPGCPF